MITLGITGRSGCGKSTVTAVFAAHGVPLADADQLSREILMPGSPLLPQLAARFGGEILRPDGTLDPRTFVMDSYNFMTPTTETETRYYWFQLRNIRPEDAELSAMMSEDVRHAFEEDRAVLNQVQIGMTSKTSPHIDLSIDAGPLRFRRQLEAMIAQEALVDEKMQG